ncbi:myosin heavy chain kinase, putative [Ichthyophthirius multifiliis]|uniref:Myosin heavy chain kinase, putative n=1 Tax=Ichthyophthirius multifiliis TaxID=5932 RepID=G0QTK1_ICHMU|nr:myosin heavy chain kinase, putative [Ichthyophthirius multifiliis]EGR31452.1 myosin heavy chain kinase, putative [Ichthyophthirius multifiliis]|eukprot:XP_004034938.1 myosin heavy chain kinase, putative [Ichthyophthirius multifiliis]
MKKVFKSKAYKDKLKGHQDGVIKMYAPYGPESGLLLSVSKDGCIRAWDLIERKITTKLHVNREGNDPSVISQNQNENEGQQSNDESNDQAIKEDQQKKIKENKNIDQFSAACFSENSIYGGFEDGLICSWNIKSGELTSLYKGHSKQITQLEFLNSRLLVSSSLDESIRVWDTMSGQNETIFVLGGAVSQLKIQSKYIEAIINKDTFIQINSDNQQIQYNIKFTSTIITCFVTYKTQLIISNINNIIEIYDLQQSESNNLQPLFIVENNIDWIQCMKVFNNLLYTAGDDNKIKVWDLEKKFALVEDFVGHEDCVVCLEFADNMLYSGSFDHSIRSWNLKEMENRIRERSIIFKEDIWSRKYEAWYKIMYKKKKKGKKGKKK